MKILKASPLAKVNHIPHVDINDNPIAFPLCMEIPEAFGIIDEGGPNCPECIQIALDKLDAETDRYCQEKPSRLSKSKVMKLAVRFRGLDQLVHQQLKAHKLEGV